MPRLDLGLGFQVLGSDGAAVTLRVAFPRVVQPGTAYPVDVLLHFVHVVERVEHVVQDSAREEHVVDALLFVVGHSEFRDPEAALQDAEKALHVVPHILQRRGEGDVTFECRVLGRHHKSHPLDTETIMGLARTAKNNFAGGQRSVGQIYKKMYDYTDDSPDSIAVHLTSSVHNDNDRQWHA